MLVLEHAHTEPSKKLNDTSGDSLPDVFADHPTEFVEWDDQVVGLGRRLRAATRPRWIVQTRVNGVSRKRVLGDAEAISLIDARLAAISLLKRIRADDPDETPDAPDPLATVEEFSAIYLADCKNRWKPSTQRRNASQFRRCIVPTFGAKRIRDLSKDDVQNWYHFAPGKPGTLNVDLALLSGMMRHAELLGIRPPGRQPLQRPQTAGWELQGALPYRRRIQAPEQGADGPGSRLSDRGWPDQISDADRMPKGRGCGPSLGVDT